MTGFLRNKAIRGPLVALAVAALLPVGLTAASSAGAAPPQTVTAAASTTYLPAGEQARKPYMGWSSYSMQVYSPTDGGWITAAQIEAQSDAMHQNLQPYPAAPASSGSPRALGPDQGDAESPPYLGHLARHVTATRPRHPGRSLTATERWWLIRGRGLSTRWRLRL